MVSSSLTDRSYRPSAAGFSLRPSADALFDAFGGEPASESAWRCQHCVTDADVAALAGPVAELSPELAGRFLRKAFCTWGDGQDVRRLAPRLLVLAADHQLPVSRRLLWRQMARAGWTDWPQVQTEAVGRFLLAEFTRLLRASPRPAHVAHRWLGEVAVGIEDLSGFLTVWHDTMGPLPEPAIQAAAVGHLVELLTSSPLRPDLPDTMGSVFPDAPHAADQLTEFLCGPGVEHELKRALAQQAGTPGARRIGVAAERLRRFRAAAS